MDYRCDICGERYEWDDIVWMTSSYGVCEHCYDTLTEHQKELIYKEG